ncbi:MAG TPA: hypothetical protein VH352_07315 [Pseudonocardiaceae bacterium]|nr:hypothetical protein [Pseudonocardiaceae bacterium]
MMMAAPAGPVGPPPAVVIALNNIQVTDPVTGLLVLGPDPNNPAPVPGASVLMNGVLTIIVNAGVPNELNGGPVIGNNYDITTAAGNFLGIQFRSNTPFLYRFR